MGEWVLTAAIWLYYQCAYFMLNLAALFDLTYRDTNIAILFILWPAVTGLLLLWVGSPSRASKSAS